MVLRLSGLPEPVGLDKSFPPPSGRPPAYGRCSGVTRVALFGYALPGKLREK